MEQTMTASKLLELLANREDVHTINGERFTGHDVRAGRLVILGEHEDGGITYDEWPIASYAMTDKVEVEWYE